MLNYLSRYIKDLSSKVIHLRKLTHQNIEWKWTDVENCEFENVKECVASAPTLKYFNVNEPVIKLRLKEITPRSRKSYLLLFSRA
ncbi:hypothetical protein QE152_g10397 [Popillia japonica]|uniref:Uncharacterized protein n=1 Tax=Popillia japonica TaxID=7064 RepID=A0AAW1LRF6_POPJA